MSARMILQSLCPHKLKSSLGGIGTGNPAKSCAGHHSRAGGIVPVPQAAKHLTGSVESGDRPTGNVLNLGSLRIDLEPPEGEGNAAADGIAFKWRLFDTDRVVTLPNWDPGRSFAIAAPRIRIQLAVLDRRVEFSHRPDQAFRIDA